jgi:GT2 family glycosyltransferase
VSGSISVVIPVHGRAGLTRRCLETVLATVPGATEIVVVDDASADATGDILAAFGDAIRVITLPQNSGFANACNQGAAAAGGELLVFLNNDTEPESGWVEALQRHAAANPQADVVGAKLVYPPGPIQHAGVVFGQDGYPHNLYAGFPADHAAVNHPRRLQAVTAACMLVRHESFEAVEGFDTGFQNSLEDVDLCLRIGERGGEVHYCPEAVVLHLESASRGRENRFETSVALYRERWRQRVRRDDLEVYAEDGLIAVEYPTSYPVRMAISPRLAIVEAGREEEIELLLEAYARQVSDLMEEVVRLTTALSDLPATVGRAEGPAAAATPASADTVDHASFLARARSLEAEIQALQVASEEMGNGFLSSSRLGYRELVERVRVAIGETTPPGATVLVISRGDRALVGFDERDGQHFPQDGAGNYSGHHPRDSREAIEHLEALRAGGAGYLVVPSTAAWWLRYYGGFAGHLDRYRALDLEGCSIYDLDVLG